MSFPSDFDETYAFFYFGVDAFNNAGGTSSMDDMSVVRQQCKNLELERYVQQNRKIPISIALGQDKPLLPHFVRFNCTIGVLMRETFSVRFLKLANVTLEYIELVMDKLQAKRSSLTTTVVDPSSFYNDSTSSLNDEDFQSIKWELFRETYAGCTESNAGILIPACPREFNTTL
ncbi:(R)-mandelonitrile lyase 1-like [Cucumis melo var. makuwa]|uniref:(R)-mandelonitrile lyase 1-like n=1 Tax=Cucumis melo var. makuwa TaxID=1194695 RepID=A0A5A7VJM4_CUCMM|nr:(R)-mandelonitrile lyase 1-like [Cucumis melo var. makuwa]TYK15516.1 (R)-mandelonitrile lyase 1-like [Cucumis melo var. makuwa]